MDHHHHHLPKFKSIPPPSLISPSSYQLALSDLLLDSPVLFSNSNLVASPTTGAFAGEAAAGLFNFNNYGRGNNKWSDDFTFQLPREPAEVKSEFHHPGQRFNICESQQGGINREQKKKSTSDGYRWRKYGQKQVKGSENPRSYYKCTYPNCPTKKKVETSLEDGHVTEIVYKGTHNHPKPHSTTNYSLVSQPPPYNATPAEVSTTSNQSPRMDDDDSTSVSTGGGEPDFEGMSGHLRRSRGNNYDEDDIETEASYHPKRWKGGDGEYNNKGSDNKTVREPRVVVQTLSEIDILDDGYRWRKYGQKVVKGNPNPRSYYKCTYMGCPVRKHVERAAQDTRAVITTYEGKHNHDIPVGRGANALHNAAAPHPPPITIRPTAIPTTTTTTSTSTADNQGRLVVFGYRAEEEMFQQTNTSVRLSNNNLDSIMSTTKEEPTDTSFFASFLS